MRRWKLLALDIDGTTIVRGKRLSYRNRESILRAQHEGLYVTFATGRHRKGMVSEIVDELHIQVPFVTLNGGEVWTPDGTLLSRRTISSSDVKFLYSLAQKYGVSCWGSTTEMPVNEDAFPRPLESKSWVKFGYHTDNFEALRKLWGELEAQDKFSLSNSDPYNIEVNAQYVNKGAGLENVVKHLGITAGDSVVMGDSLNDVPMFHWAGMSIAVGNAQQPVKDAAAHITLTCEEDAVSYVIERILGSEW
ncbi:Cof-type HAD-IIB family hydrolase [Alicyclobacillus sp. SO9]|uniref:Cof-type HAD-IIB family hydrolase n=1 Tax=Alicyclobacillus sp. SO9 TaxID=2665646 RepID=UPI0018E7232A|nr:Cof-type HAD-IIB family hydrolase [Alicyclobacillus sp. SO9]QQE78152.1 HAD family phosphatase [Alicyclobacillus sp. SO9]